ncbi:hypothetical protein A0H81_14183 [Grifola frondosa]|uniref:Uncharacterized protein n=1 Tax=Grifola frondosa TaxID=5627 RepID=A0A1C7LMF9_GRIFR|nr:hypothetical protein A0H81_14183 [Grifola frondosa]
MLGLATPSRVFAHLSRPPSISAGLYCNSTHAHYRLSEARSTSKTYRAIERLFILAFSAIFCSKFFTKRILVP